MLSVRVEERLTIKETAKRFKIGVATLTRWIRKIDPVAIRKRPWIKIDIVELARDIRAHPDAYLYERAERLGVSRSGIFEALRRMDVTYKKSPTPSQGERRQTARLPQGYQNL